MLLIHHQHNGHIEAKIPSFPCGISQRIKLEKEKNLVISFGRDNVIVITQIEWKSKKKLKP